MNLLEATPPSQVRSRDYYHGTTSGIAAEQIIEEGIVPGNMQLDTTGQLTPVSGKVYLTPDIGYAQMYAIGGNYAGEPRPRPGRFGWLFVVSGADLVDVQPDEDEVGQFAAGGVDQPKWASNVSKPDIIRKFILGKMSSRQRNNARQGLYAFYASGGKRALRSMPDEYKQELVAAGSHVAHAGKIHPREAWRIDLRDIPFLNKDGSNFFSLAHQLT